MSSFNTQLTPFYQFELSPKNKNINQNLNKTGGQSIMQQ